MRRFGLAVAVCVLAATASGPAPARASLLPQVDSQLLDDTGNPIDGTLDSGLNVHIHATVSGSGAAPTSTVTFRHFATADCTGTPTGGPTAGLVTNTVPAIKAADLSNGSGWDSATAWNSNGMDYLGTNWAGGLFAGNDVGFASSSMAWRFNGASLRSDDLVTDAYLALRIRKSRPGLASEGPSTWKTVLAVDLHGGSNFEGETRAAFLARFYWGGTWEVPLSPEVRDPFGTNDGANYGRSPDVTALVQNRIEDQSWAPGEGIVLGVLNHGTSGIAEAEVVDQPDNARLHIEWTTTEEVQSADSGALTPDLGVQSYQAHYDGDAVYSTAAGPCMSLAVSSPAPNAPSVGGVAEQPDVATLGPRMRRRQAETTRPSSSGPRARLSWLRRVLRAGVSGGRTAASITKARTAT